MNLSLLQALQWNYSIILAVIATLIFHILLPWKPPAYQEPAQTYCAQFGPLYRSYRWISCSSSTCKRQIYQATVLCNYCAAYWWGNNAGNM
jgi:hypothetical protein